MTGINSDAMPDPIRDNPFDPWNFRPDVVVEMKGALLSGYQVEAVDGSVGKVTNSGTEPEDSYLVVSTGRLFGREVLLPAGTVNHIDHTERRIYLNRSRDQVKHAPEVPAEQYHDQGHRDEVAGYYDRSLHSGS